MNVSRVRMKARILIRWKVGLLFVQRRSLECLAVVLHGCSDGAEFFFAVQVAALFLFSTLRLAAPIEEIPNDHRRDACENPLQS